MCMCVQLYNTHTQRIHSEDLCTITGLLCAPMKIFSRKTVIFLYMHTYTYAHTQQQRQRKRRGRRPRKGDGLWSSMQRPPREDL
jgi:hypothetical protein